MASSAVLRRPAPSARELRADVVLAAVILIGTILSAALSSMAQIYGDEQAPLTTALVYAAVLAGPLAVRRRWPATVAVIVSGAYFVAVTLRIPEIYVGNIAMFIGLYTVGAWSPNRRRAFVVRAGIIVGMFAWLVIAMYRDALRHAEEADMAAAAFSPYLAHMLITVFINMLYFGGAYYFGERAWASATERAALEERTAELEGAREVTAAQAVALDRVRIARELHDVVAHHVSVMGVQAGAARAVIDRDRDAARELLVGVESSAREAIGELHHLLETLRSPGGPSPEDAAAAPEAPATAGVADLPTLVEASSSAGLPTTLRVVGDPRPVAQLVGVNLYRIAQEALTNARRHAGPDATAEVRLRYDGADVELEVTNTGRVAPAARPGLGQLGMRERAAASGGTIELGPRERGGFLVRARVPADLAVPAEVPEVTG